MAGKKGSGGWILIGILLAIGSSASIFWQAGLLYLTYRLISNIVKGARSSAAQVRGKNAPDNKVSKSGLVFLTTGLWISTAMGFKLPGILLSAYGAGLVGWHAFNQYRSRLFKKYASVIGSRRAVPVAEIAAAMPVNYERACRDIQNMIDNGELPASAYIDAGNRCLVFDSSAIIEVKPELEPKNTIKKSDTDVYKIRINEIRALNSEIDDAAVSGYIDQIEALTASIFRTVSNDPVKLPHIHKFMNYYLPTTLKLLKQYSILEQQPLGGKNVSKSRRDIERVLVKLVQGFEHYLDQLYSADAIDITSDINVLETMMARDGLAENQYVFARKSGSGGGE
jgi:hypothetical protein